MENTLRVKHEQRIVLWFMGTAEESRSAMTVLDACAVHGLRCRG